MANKKEIKKKVGKKTIVKKKATVRSGGPLKVQIEKSIITKLSKIVESGHILGVTKSQLSENFSQEHNMNISRQKIASLLNKVYDSVPKQEINHIKIKFETMFDRIFRVAQDMLVNAKTEKDKQIAADLLLRCMDKFTDFLERFGIKEKVADEVKVTADITSKSFSFQIIDDRSKIENK